MTADTQKDKEPNMDDEQIRHADLGALGKERGIYRDVARRFLKNKLSVIGSILVALLVIMAVFADDWFIAIPLGREPTPLIAKTAYDKAFYGPVGAFPSQTYWMGTDLIGRDVFSRIVYGTRISLSIGLLAQLVAFAVGLPLGSLAGWKGGWIDFVVMRFVDIMSALPVLLLAVMLMARIGAGYWNVMLVIGMTSWLSVCRLTRAQFLSIREKEFVEAARAVGTSGWGIIRLHLFPNALAPIVVAFTLGIPIAIFAEASLSFLGVGINPPMPSWGQMLSREGITNMTYYWHLAFFPALMIAITMLGFTLLGDGLRDALDPHMIDQK